MASIRALLTRLLLTVSYGDCDVSYTTHAIDGLSDNDFICAAKIDQLAAAAE